MKPLIFVSAARGREESLKRLLDQLGTRWPIHLHTDMELKGSLKPWLRGMSAAASAAQEDYNITHVIWLPDDAILCDGWHDAMLAAIESHPDDILCMYANHPGADELVGKAAWYTTPDGFVGFAGTMRTEDWWAYLQWRDDALKKPEADHRTRYGVANDEGVNLWAMTQGRPILKAVESLVDHDDSIPSLDGNGHHAMRRAVTFTKNAKDIDWTTEPVDLGRTYRGNHWNLLRKLKPKAAAEHLATAYDLERGGPPLERCIMIATPAYERALGTEYVLSLLDTTQELSARGISWQFRSGHWDSLICRGRNRMTHEFLKSDASHLLFIDSDIGWHTEDVLRLISSGKDVIGGVYPKKQMGKDGRSPCVVNIAHEKLGPDGRMLVENGCVPVQDTGTGFLLISRKALYDVGATILDSLRVSNFERAEELDQPYLGWFDPFVENEHDLSEDYAFCRRWQRAGGTVYVHIDCELTHTGSHTFRGALRDAVVSQEPA